MKFHRWADAFAPQAGAASSLSLGTEVLTVRERGCWLGGGTDVRSLIVVAPLVAALTALAVTPSAL
jgi:hypothetical protein